MATIQSKKVTVSQPAATTFHFLEDLNNFRQLMPEDRISDWQSTATECSFQIKGLARIGMKMGEKTEPTLIKLVSNGKNPFPFELNIHLDPTSADSSTTHINFQGQMNPFMKMMVEKPLTNFFNMLVDRLQTLSEGN